MGRPSKGDFRRRDDGVIKPLLYKAKWWLHHPTAFARFAEIMANLGKSPDQLAAEQELARRRIVRHAMQHTAFYKRHYAASGFEIGDIGADGWFERLPLVTKRELRESFPDFIDRGQRQFLSVSTTGGSTGVPTKTGYDRRIPEEVYSWRLQSSYGVHPWDDHAYVWRDTRRSRWAKLKNAAAWWPTRHLKLDATLLSDVAMDEFIERFNRIRPCLLQGYVGAVSQLAEHVLKSGKAIDSPPKVVWTTSAPLSEVQRRLVERAFGAPVCNEYGSCECRWIAFQMPGHDGLRVNTEHVHLEFLQEPGGDVQGYGRAVLTNLEDTVFPLIRYENGDRGRWLDYPYIDSVKGREVESFVLPSGKVINGEYLTTIFDASPDLVYGFRAVQHADLSITIEYVPAGEERLVQDVLRRFAEKLSGEAVVDFRRVDRISHDRGKLRFVVREAVARQ